MGTKQDILIRFLRDGMSQRNIETETGVSRKTISKYIKEYENQRKKLLEKNPERMDDIRELIDAIVEEPKYYFSTRTKRKVTEEVEAVIQAHLNENTSPQIMRR